MNSNPVKENTILNPNGLKFSRLQTNGEDPYKSVSWVKHDVINKSWRDGSITFEQRGVEFPEFWSPNAVNIVTTKYFRGALGTKERENSLRDIVERVATSYRLEGLKYNYFYSENDANIFYEEMVYSLLHQEFAFNSPVWFNVGTKSPWQVSACYILAVEDSMDGILDWYKEEGLIFKGGSGAGINLSKIRSSKELLSSGGQASGPVSFMRGADSSAGTIKSGGATRRAAKMVILDVDHPDIMEFIHTKSLEEKKIRALRDAGFDMDLGGKDTISVQYQNANNSVRVNDQFMEAALNGKKYPLIARSNGAVLEEVEADKILDAIAQAAWECADPGIQYDNEIQKMHTLPNNGRISATNPCSEFVHLDNSSCNLASLKLTAFYNKDTKIFDINKFKYLTRLLFTAAEISVSFGHFPTPKIGEVTKASRPIGLGYTDLGALLMIMGLPYDSNEGRNLAASITALLTAESYLTSTELAKAVGSFEYYENNKKEMGKVIELHEQSAQKLLTEINLSHDIDNTLSLSQESIKTYKEAILKSKKHGYRNSQTTVLAPTGTISFFMDSTTTGVEPDFSLVKFKKIADGSSVKIVNDEVRAALKGLNYPENDIKEIIDFIQEHGSVKGSPHLSPDHQSIFATAVGEDAISPRGHILMMAALQPFISGAISKTVNMPEETTVAEVKETYILGWELGLKAVAIYRDNCKVGQPLTQVKKEKTSSTKSSNYAENLQNTQSNLEQTGKPLPQRVRLPRVRPALTTSFTIGSADGYITAGAYNDGELGELFLKMSKQGSTLAGVMDAFAIAVSIGLQYGVPLETFVEKFTNTRFEPSGMTNDPEVRMASSVMDYVFKRLAIDHLPYDVRSSLGIFTNQERANELENSYKPEPIQEIARKEDKVNHHQIKDEKSKDSNTVISTNDAPLCYSCGVQMQRAGSCHVCPNCGSTSGCS